MDLYFLLACALASEPKFLRWIGYSSRKGVPLEIADKCGCQFLSKLDNLEVYCTMFCHFHDSLLAHQIIFLFYGLQKGNENGAEPNTTWRRMAERESVA